MMSYAYQNVVEGTLLCIFEVVCYKLSVVIIPWRQWVVTWLVH